MASIAPDPAARDEQQAWNEASDRLAHFLNTFALADRIYVSRLTLRVLDEARQVYLQDKSRPPVTLTMERAQKHLADWLAAHLDVPDKSPSEILATGYIALLLSRIYRESPTAFLASPLPENIHQSLRQTLLVTGPGLNLSSMTPRHLDYGPMLQLARQTWHRFDFKATLLAVLFWTGVYFILYQCLAQIL
jgi:hypothetical protein